MGKIYALFNYQNASKSIPLPSLAHLGEFPPPPNSPPTNVARVPILKRKPCKCEFSRGGGGLSLLHVVVVLFLAARGFSVLVLWFSPPLKILTLLGEK